jgi:hypothetical protein
MMNCEEYKASGHGLHPGTIVVFVFSDCVKSWRINNDN